MPISEILAGRNQLTERPIPDRRYRFNMSVGDDMSKPVFVALTYDTRHTYVNGSGVASPILLLADDANEVIHLCSVDPDIDTQEELMAGIQSLRTVPYPHIVDSSLVTTGEDKDANCHQCMGLATIETPDDSYIMLLSEPQIGHNYTKEDATGNYKTGRNGTQRGYTKDYPARYPILYKLALKGSLNGVFDSSNISAFDYEVVDWVVVDAGNVASTAGVNDETTVLPATDSSSNAYKREGYTQCNIYAEKDTTVVDRLKHSQKDDIGRGLSAYHGDLLTIGKWNGVDSIITIDSTGQPLAQHPTFANSDRLCGIQYINGRTYTTMDGSSNPEINGRILAKFLTEQIDTARMVPLMSIEPFFFQPVAISKMNARNDFDDNGKRRAGARDKTYAFGPDITIFQDRMAACFLNNLYTYRMAYFTFLVDGMPNDDIDMGSVLIGDYKIKKVTFKNIADVYNIRKIELTVDKGSVGTTTPMLRKLKEAMDWVFLTATDPTNDTTDIVKMSEQNASGNGLPSGTIWSQTLELATQPPYIAPDGEINFYMAVGIPATYTDNEAVSTDDGPYIIPMIVKCILG